MDLARRAASSDLTDPRSAGMTCQWLQDVVRIVKMLPEVVSGPPGREHINTLTVCKELVSTVPEKSSWGTLRCLMNACSSMAGLHSEFRRVVKRQDAGGIVVSPAPSAGAADVASGQGHCPSNGRSLNGVDFEGVVRVTKSCGESGFLIARQFVVAVRDQVYTTVKGVLAVVTSWRDVTEGLASVTASVPVFTEVEPKHWVELSTKHHSTASEVGALEHAGVPSAEPTPVPPLQPVVVYRHRGTLDATSSIDAELISASAGTDVVRINIGSASVVVYGTPMVRSGAVRHIEVELGELDEALDYLCVPVVY